MADDETRIFAIGEDALRNVIQRSGGAGSDGGDMNERVTRLETHFGYIRRDLDNIKDKLSALPTLATKRDLLTWAGIYLAIVAILLGGIIGGLSLLKP